MAFWKPGTIAPGSNIDREAEKEAGENVIAFNRNVKRSISYQRAALPIYKNRNEILYCVETYPVTIIVGATGSGKTTQIPQYLHESGWTSQNYCVACTQPRRVAATSVAIRVAEEMGVSVGSEVGYCVRFDDVTSSQTRIKYMTDGMLVREMMLDPLLSAYSVIMVDEAHERSVYTDILCGILKKVQKRRPELRLIISSATLDAEFFYNYFNTNTTDDKSKDTAYIMSLDGRAFPVETYYLPTPCTDYLTSSLETVLDIHKSLPPGDILVFLTGQEEIDEAVRIIREETHVKNLWALPLYGGLPMEQQLQVFSITPPKTRKVVFTTNIAEASVTIDGIAYVIDCGFVKIRAYNPRTTMSVLTVIPISKAAAIQRAGRAGRTRPGTCFRMYTETAYNQLRDTNIPEIQRTDLSPILLQLKSLGIENVAKFGYLSPPPAESLERALEILYTLGAIDDWGRLTVPFGQSICEFPCEPRVAAMLLNSPKFSCTEQALTLAAMLTVPPLFASQRSDIAKANFAVEEGDHITLLNVYDSFVNARDQGAFCSKNNVSYKALVRAKSVRNQLSKYLKKFGVIDGKSSSTVDTESILKCLLSGFFTNVATLEPDGSYRMIRGGKILWIHPSSVLYNRSPQCVFFCDVVETNKAYMRDVGVIEKEWVIELAPHFYEWQTK